MGATAGNRASAWSHHFAQVLDPGLPGPAVSHARARPLPFDDPVVEPLHPRGRRRLQTRMDCNTAAHFQPMDVSSLGEALAGHQDHGGAPGRGRASAGAGQPAADVLAAAQSLQAAAAPAASSDSESTSDSSDSESSSPHARAELERGAASAGGPAASPVDPNAIHARATSPVGASSVSSWASSEDEADTAPGRGGKARGPAAAAAPDQASVADGDVSDDEAEEADGPSSALFGGPRTKNELPVRAAAARQAPARGDA